MEELSVAIFTVSVALLHSYFLLRNFPISVKVL